MKKKLLEKDEDQRSTRKTMEPQEDAPTQWKHPVKGRKHLLKKEIPSQMRKRPSDKVKDKLEE